MNALPSFDALSVWVVGDAMLDTYLCGDAHRISPEAPVPVVNLTSRRRHLGGAANVAANCAAWGAKTVLWCVAGSDQNGSFLADEARAQGIDLSITIVDGRPTTAKTRIIAHDQHILRMDEECAEPLPAEIRKDLAARLREAPSPDVIIVSDYAKGMVCTEVMEAVRSHRPRAYVLVDPKRPDLSFYRGVDAVKPNVVEAARAIGCSVAEVFEAGCVEHLRRQVDRAELVVTCGSRGIVIIDTRGGLQRVPTDTLHVFDVTGAGDTVAAAYALSVASGMPSERAAQVANLAAGVAVAQLGTTVVSRLQVELALRRVMGRSASKLVTREQLLVTCSQSRRSGRRVVFTNGCFDVLHAGHVHLLERARRLGDVLVVGLNSDASVARLKGVSRPVNSEGDRAMVLAGLGCVDAVVVFEEDTPFNLIRQLRPDCLVKGGDYTEGQIIGADFVRQNGGQVEVVPLLIGRSTSRILAAGA